MLRIDSHVHVTDLSGPKPLPLLARLSEAGFDGCVLLSAPHEGFADGGGGWAWRERLDDVLAWTKGHDTLFPFFWIDPVAPDAVGQVEQAARAGIRGFKAICSHHLPGDERAMPTYEAIARSGRPLLFHSGILWDGQPSSMNNRPASFESLLPIKDLRFAHAHASWPWIDECLAVYGKFLNAHASRDSGSAEMFIDVTPGTPRIYREELYRKIFGIGYDIDRNLLFGTDGDAANYSVAWAREWANRDEMLIRTLLSPEQSDETKTALFGGNLLRFIDPASDAVERRAAAPVPGR
jgi:predicted TIM-barrel fold metal-dependent hydrolase